MASETLPPKEKTLARLQDESVTLVGAGIHTVRWSISLTCFYILSNSKILQHLKAELVAIWPDINNPPTLRELEKLPYLTALIQEGEGAIVSSDHLIGWCSFLGKLTG